jgi:hypothetical protein
VELDAIGGQGPGFVQAQQVDMTDRLDRIGFLDQRSLARYPQRAHGIGHGGHEEKTLGHQGHDNGCHAHSFNQGQALDQERDGQQDTQLGGQQYQDADDKVDVSLQRRLDLAKGPGAGGHLVDHAVGADALGLVESAARHAVATRVARLSGLLGYPLRLASKQRLVYFHLPVADHLAIDDDLVTGTGNQHVAQHDLGGVKAPLLSIAEHSGLGTGQEGNLVQLALGPTFLVDAHDDIQ